MLLGNEGALAFVLLAARACGWSNSCRYHSIFNDNSPWQCRALRFICRCLLGQKDKCGYFTLGLGVCNVASLWSSCCAREDSLARFGLCRKMFFFVRAPTWMVRAAIIGQKTLANAHIDLSFNCRHVQTNDPLIECCSRLDQDRTRRI